MNVIKNLYNLIQIPASAYEQINSYKEFALDTNLDSVRVEFKIIADKFDLKDIHSVYWNFGDLYSDYNEKNANELIYQNINKTITHNYRLNGMYDVNCIINTSTYIIHLYKKIKINTTERDFFVNIDKESIPDIYIATMGSIDPQGMILYNRSIDAFNGLPFKQYTQPVTGLLTDTYIQYKAKFSDGTKTIIYAQPISDFIRVDLLNVFDVTSTEAVSSSSGIDIVNTGYTTNLATPLVSSSYIGTPVTTGSNLLYQLDNAVKIRFVNDKISQHAYFIENNTVSANSHNYANTEKVYLYNIYNNSLTADSYYVTNRTNSTFQLSNYIAGGDIVEFTPTGSAVAEVKTDILSLPTSGAVIRYRFKSSGSTRTYKYKRHLIIPSSDTLYWQLYYYTINAETGLTEYVPSGVEQSVIFIIEQGISHDNVNLNQQVYGYSGYM